jgi:hypothetical protein
MRLPLLILALVAASGCEKPPVEWQEPTALPDVGAVSRLVLDSAGRARFVAEPALATRPPEFEGLCSTSLRMAAALTRVFGTWWRVRPDSSSLLQVSSSADSGKTWAAPSAVDTTDVSSTGCNRPPPSITTVGDDVYVAYSMSAPEGTGVFFAHSMGAMLHSPVTVIYGERLVPTAIAAEGERVVVAYDEPNGSRQQIDIAYSPTQGHIFEWRRTATRDIDVATSPSVALAGNVVAVAWATRRSTDSATSRVVRVGRIVH